MVVGVEIKLTVVEMPDIPEITATCLSYEYGCEREFKSSRVMGQRALASTPFCRCVNSYVGVFVW
jgi:hypothetical protein